jgi:hypothetical protein
VIHRIAIAAVALAGGLSGPLANADPDNATVICQQSRLGVTPGQIAEGLHRGDGRVSIWQAGQQVRDALRGCDD